MQQNKDSMNIKHLINALARILSLPVGLQAIGAESTPAPKPFGPLPSPIC